MQARTQMQKMKGKMKYIIMTLVVLTLGTTLARMPIQKEQKLSEMPKGMANKVVSGVLEGKKIVIDAGHGGGDVGSIREGINEKDINLSIAQKVQQLLEQQGATVIMTRAYDQDLSLEARTKISNDSKADLFVSIHQNAIEDNVTHGIETWFEEAKIESRKLAECVQASVIEATNGKDRGTKSHESFYVTQNTKAPSVLVECGFISSDTERMLLKDSTYQDHLARGIVKGISQYFSI